MVFIVHLVILLSEKEYFIAESCRKMCGRSLRDTKQNRRRNSNKPHFQGKAICVGMVDNQFCVTNTKGAHASCPRPT